MGVFRLLRLISRDGVVMACCQRPYPRFLVVRAGECSAVCLWTFGLQRRGGYVWGRGSWTPYFTGFAHSHLLSAASAWLAGFWAGWLLPLLLGWLAVALVGCCLAAVWLASCCGGWWLAWRLFRNLSCWLKSRPAALLLVVVLWGLAVAVGCLAVVVALLAGLWLVAWSLGLLGLWRVVCCAVLAWVGRSVGALGHFPPHSPSPGTRAATARGPRPGVNNEDQRRWDLGVS